LFLQRRHVKKISPMDVGAWKRMLVSGLSGLAIGVMLTVCAAAATSRPPLPGEIQKTLKQVADWQLAHMASDTDNSVENGWVAATFYIGLARWSAQSNDPTYFRAVRKFGQRNNWRLGPRLYHADDHAVGQVYVVAFDRYGDTRVVASMQDEFNRILGSKPDVPLAFDETALCQKRWCWCDALFMAPASWMALSRITGDPRYRAYADAEFWATKDYLFDATENLFVRDSRFFNARGPDGEKIFWGRGNGWVFAGLVNILRELPRDFPGRERYEKLFIVMAEKLVALPRPDGFWSSSLMSRPESGVAESSGTAFFAYGLASGVNLGLLDRKRFAAAALRGWFALAGAIDRKGRIGRVQGIGYRPGPAGNNDSEPFAAGGVLLAGTALRTMIDRSHQR
jgi:unsaturated rhamnogalacturonyl hydrolase